NSRGMLTSQFASMRVLARVLLVPCALIAAALPAACGRSGEEQGQEIRPVRAMTITEAVSGNSVTLTGVLQAQAEVNESFRIDGRLIDRAVDVGDRVRPGQLLARLDPMNEESNYQSARSQLGAAQAQAIQAQFNYARMRDLFAEHAVSKASYEQA